MTNPTATNADAVDSLLAAARQHAEQGAIRQADELFQRVLDIAPDQYEALHFLGMRALAEGRAVGRFRPFTTSRHKGPKSWHGAACPPRKVMKSGVPPWPTSARPSSGSRAYDQAWRHISGS